MTLLDVVQTLFGLVLAAIAVHAGCETASGWWRRRGPGPGARTRRRADRAASHTRGETGGQRGQ
jgi:hypothetical protein